MACRRHVYRHAIPVAKLLENAGLRVWHSDDRTVQRNVRFFLTSPCLHYRLDSRNHETGVLVSRCNFPLEP